MIHRSTQSGNLKNEEEDEIIMGAPSGYCMYMFC